MQLAKHNSVFVYLLPIILLFCCAEKDTVAPIISIDLPIEGTVYNVFDTVFVSFTAIDETQLLAISAQIVDANFIPVGSSLGVSVSQSSSAGSAELVLGDKLLSTGDYYVSITATDGVNETREFRKIRIVALPKKRRAIYLSTSAISGTVWRVDSLFQNVSSWVQPGQDVLKLCINSLKNRLILIGNQSTGIKNYDISSSSIVWIDEVFNVSGIKRYTDLTCFENNVFVSIFDREIRSYGIGGALTMNQQTGNFRPETIYVDGSYILVELNLVGGSEHFISVYHSLTKALLWQLEIPMEIVSICELDEDEVLLFGNYNGQARVLLYDISNNGFWEPRQLPSGEISDAVKMEGRVFAIAHEDGLYSYTYSPNYLNLIRAGTVYQNLCFDVDKATIIGATQNMLDEVAVNGQVINTVVLSDSITSIDIHYTR